MRGRGRGRASCSRRRVRAARHRGACSARCTGSSDSPLAAPIVARADVDVRGHAGRRSRRPLGSTRACWSASHSCVDGSRRGTTAADGACSSTRRATPPAGCGCSRRATASRSAAGSTPLTGFDTRWRWQHAVGDAARDRARRGAHAPASPLDADRQRSARARCSRAPSTSRPIDRALLAGFLLGDTRGAARRRSTEQFRAAGPHALTAVSGGNVAFVLALVAPAAAPARGCAAGSSAALAVLVLFGTMTRWEPSVLRAIAMAAIALLAGLPRPAHRRAARARARRDRAAARRPVPAALGRLPALVRREPRHRAAGAPDHRAAPRPAAGCARCSASPPPRRSGSRRCSIPVFGSMPLVALPANLVAVPLAAPLTMWGLVAGVVSGGSRRRVAPALAAPARSSRPSALLHALHRGRRRRVARFRSRSTAARRWRDRRGAWPSLVAVAPVA